MPQVARAKESEIKQLARVSRTIERLEYGIMNYYDYRINSGVIEGVNNNIKTLVNKEYGCRNKAMIRVLKLAARRFGQERL